MSEFNSYEEDRLIWTRTRDEILERWELYNKWSTVSRIATMFGDSEKDEESVPIPGEENSAAVFNKMETLFGGA